MGQQVAVMLEADIRRKSVQTRLGERVVLAGLRFKLNQGEIVALVGPSGCGKSTTLRLVGGLDPAFEGQLVWAGGQRPRIGTVFQEPRLLPWRTVRQNIDLVRPPDSASVDRLLGALDLTSSSDAYPPTLSLGMARRVAIARAFAIDPELMLLDEPFVSLDAATAEQGRQVLLDIWRRRPTTAILVTHDMPEAAALADRILVMTAAPALIRHDINVPREARRRGIAYGAEVADDLISRFRDS